MKMAFSSIITSINSALDDLDFMIPRSYSSPPSFTAFKNSMYRLRNLKMFVLCARKLGNEVHLRSNDNKNADGNLVSLLTRIEYAVGRCAREIHSCLKLKDLVDTSNEDARGIASSLENDIESLKEEIDERYITMSDYTRQSNSRTADEVVEITEVIVENLLDFPFPSFSEITVDPMEAFLEHMKFLTNFCLFVTKSRVEHEQIEVLLTHTEAVSISAAHLCFLCGVGNDNEEWRKEIQFKILTLLQKIRPIDPQVHVAYNQALSCSKLSIRLHAPRQDMDDDSTIGMKNFVDSLIYIFWDILRLDTCHVISLKDDRQVLYEGLRSLRTILKKLLDQIDEKTNDVIRAMVCDAGVLICSFYQKNVEIDLRLEDLLERMKLFLAEVEEKVPQPSIFYSPGINELGFIDFLLENLVELTNDKVEPVVKSHVQTIKELLLYLRTLLSEIVELYYEQEELQALWIRVLEVAYQVEFLIDHLVVGDTSNRFLMQFDSITENIRDIKIDALKSFYGKRQDIKVKEETRTSSHVPSPIIDSITTEVVGFHDEAISFVDRITRGSKQLRVITILGMGGIGKTTLATKIYNEPLAVRHFHVCAWYPISQTLDKKTLLLELFNQIHAEKYSEMTEEDLADKVRRHLKRRRYLIF